MNLKKKFMVFLAVGILALSAVPFAYAATPRPADNVAQEEQAAAEQSSPAGTTQYTQKKYLTRGGAAFWFVFTFVLNGAFSFWVGNRFYRMARKDNHINAEIRALRRDIEDKLVKNIGGFAEQELDINNLNESLAPDSEGIKPPEHQPFVRDISPEEEARFRRWEEAQPKPKTEHSKPKSSVREELQEDIDDVKKINRKTYQPKRRKEETSSEQQEDLGETKVMKPMGEVKTKAKEILGDIFPFKDE